MPVSPLSSSGSADSEALGSSRPDEVGALTIDTRTLGRAPGSVLDIRRTARLPESIGAELMRLEVGAEVELDLRLAWVDEGVLVTGTVSGCASVECARCLAEFSTPVSVELTEMYAHSNSAAARGVEEDEVRLLSGEDVDLLPALIDAFGLDFPLAPVCGLSGVSECSNSEIPAPDGISGETGKRIDPRWVGLAEKFGKEIGE